MIHPAQRGSARLQTVFSHPAYLPGLIAAGVLLRWIVAMWVPVDPHSDSLWYVVRAQEIVAGQGYQEAGHPTAYWPVGWPAVIAAGIALTGSAQITVLTLNLASALLIMVLLAVIGRHLLQSNTIAAIAVLLYAVYPNHIAYIGNAATETFYTALAMLAFTLAVLARARPGILLIAGALFGLATLVKAQTLLFPIGLWVLIRWYDRSLSWQRWISGLIAVYLALAAVVLPWSLRNLDRFGEFVLVSTNGGTALLMGAHDETTGDHHDYQEMKVYQRLGIPWEERVERQVELNNLQKQAAKQWIADHPVAFLAWMPRKALLLWQKDTDGFWSFLDTYPAQQTTIRALQWVNQGYYLALLILALPCVWYAFRGLFTKPVRHAELPLVLAMPIFVTLLAMVFTGQIRYHFPAMPFVILATSWSVARLFFSARRSA